MIVSLIVLHSQPLKLGFKTIVVMSMFKDGDIELLKNWEVEQAAAGKLIRMMAMAILKRCII